jgi:hypothetical protein
VLNSNGADLPVPREGKQPGFSAQNYFMAAAAERARALAAAGH